MITDEDVEIVSNRLKAWSTVLGGLSDPAACRQFLNVLDEGSGEAFHKFVDEWQLPGAGCIEIVDTITRFVHTGDYEPVEKCSFAHKLRPLTPSTSSGMGYKLPDGSILWLTEAEWWQMMDHAVGDEAWRKANHGLLVAVGILVCTFELMPTVQRFDFDRRYTICAPDWDPRAKR